MTERGAAVLPLSSVCGRGRQIVDTSTRTCLSRASRFGGHLTNTRRSDGTPDPDGELKEVVRIKIRHYRNVYLNRPDPIAFIPLAVDTTGRLYDEFIRSLFLHAQREASALANELPEESDQFRFLRASCFANLKGAVGLIMAKASVMRISIPLDQSYRPFIPLSC